MATAMFEIDSFYLKFKNLLIAGQSANLTFHAEAGKASISLNLEINVSHHVLEDVHVRVGPSRQRRRQRRVEARVAAEGAVHEEASEAVHREAEKASVDQNTFPENNAEQANSVKVNPTVNDAEQATRGSGVLHEPSDEIEIETISKETKELETKDNSVNLISVIPQKYFDMNDEMLKEAIRKKIEAKKLIVKQVDIHRTVGGAFIRSDVCIEPVAANMIKQIDFPFDNCQVIPCFGFRKKS